MRVTNSRPRLRIRSARRSAATPLASRALGLLIASAVIAGFVPASADPAASEVAFADEFAEATATGD
ncbi:hypothetical protein, partial [Aeromicrobium sp. CF3.5]|uniref:hypothetical protein n=1 Tax=Aeromicrobium sp. CF3.5 TaxID=3373078 RepID=UPI003EE4BF21